MIALFTDYGIAGPYLGEVEANLFRYAPTERVINLFADAPRQNPKACAYLLAAYHGSFPDRTIFFCVVDPGVGSGEHEPMVMRVDDRYFFVGPHNGLFDIVARRAATLTCWEVTYRPERLSKTFHGRDLYAPVCAMIANQQPIPGRKLDWQPRYDWPDDLGEIIYIDHFGNCVTGVRASKTARAADVTVAGATVQRADTFASVEPGQTFWYANSVGLVEIAVNQGSARDGLGLDIGTRVSID